MKNIPKKIYLNIGLNPYEKDDFYDIDDITWSEGVTGNNDIEYVLATPAIKAGEGALEVLKGLVSDVGNLLGENAIEWQQAGYLEEAKLLIKRLEETK